VRDNGAAGSFAEMDTYTHTPCVVPGAACLADFPAEGAEKRSAGPDFTVTHTRPRWRGAAGKYGQGTAGKRYIPILQTKRCRRGLRKTRALWGLPRTARNFPCAQKRGIISKV